MLEFHSFFYVVLFIKNYKSKTHGLTYTIPSPQKKKKEKKDIQLFTFFPITMKCPLINVNNELIINSV